MAMTASSSTPSLLTFIFTSNLAPPTFIASRGLFSLSLGGHEVCWLAQQMQGFIFTKGGNEWTKTFRGASNVLVIRLGSNAGGRFIVLEALDKEGEGKKIVFPEGVEAEGWKKLMLAMALSVEKPILSHEGELFRGVPAHLRPLQSSAEGLTMAEKLFQIVQFEGGSRRNPWKGDTLHGEGPNTGFYAAAGVSKCPIPSQRNQWFKKGFVFSRLGHKRASVFSRLGHQQFGPTTLLNQPILLNPPQAINFPWPVYNKAGPGILGPYPPAYPLWAKASSTAPLSQALFYPPHTSLPRQLPRQGSRGVRSCHSSRTALAGGERRPDPQSNFFQSTSRSGPRNQPTAWAPTKRAVVPHPDADEAQVNPRLADGDETVHGSGGRAEYEGSLGSTVRENEIEIPAPQNFPAQEAELPSSSSSGKSFSSSSKNLPQYFKKVALMQSTIDDIREACVEGSSSSDSESDFDSLTDEEEGLLIDSLRRKNEASLQEVAGEELRSLFEVEAENSDKACLATVHTETLIPRETLQSQSQSQSHSSPSHPSSPSLSDFSADQNNLSPESKFCSTPPLLDIGSSDLGTVNVVFAGTEGEGSFGESIPLISSGDIQLPDDDLCATVSRVNEDPLTNIQQVEPVHHHN